MSSAGSGMAGSQSSAPTSSSNSGSAADDGEAGAQIESQVLKGVQIDTQLNEEERGRLAKRSFQVVWKIKVDDGGLSKDDPNIKEQKYIAGVCISSVGHILSMSLTTKPNDGGLSKDDPNIKEQKYIGACVSWRKGWTAVRLLRTSTAYGLSLFQLEGMGRKKVAFTDLAESGALSVNQRVYGVGHPTLFDAIAENTFVRGVVEYPCEDIGNLPPCLMDDGHSEKEGNKGGPPLKPTYLEALGISMASTARRVEHLTWISSVQTYSKNQGTLFSMHPDIPLIQIKNFHLGQCGGPVFVSSGLVVGINFYKFRDINFAVHLSAIKEFLKGVNLTNQMAVAPEEVEQIRGEDKPTSIRESQAVAAAKVSQVDV